MRLHKESRTSDTVTSHSASVRNLIYTTIAVYLVVAVITVVWIALSERHEAAKRYERELTQIAQALSPTVGHIITTADKADNTPKLAESLRHTFEQITKSSDILGIRFSASAQGLPAADSAIKTPAGDAISIVSGITDVADPQWKAHTDNDDKLIAVTVTTASFSITLYGNERPALKQADTATKSMMTALFTGLLLLWIPITIFSRRSCCTPKGDTISESSPRSNDMPADKASPKASPVPPHAKKTQGETEGAVPEERHPASISHQSGTAENLSPETQTHPPAQQHTKEVCQAEDLQRIERLGETLSGGAIFRLVLLPEGTRRYTYLTPGFEELFGIPVGNVLENPQTLYRLILPDDLPEHMAREMESLRHQETFTSEIRMQSLKTGIRHIQFRAQPGTNMQGEPCLDGLLLDVTLNRHVEDQLREMATTDSLTGMTNRRSFMQSAEKELQRVRRYKTPMSLMMVDADHFKRVNDTYGHDAGDDVLIALARTMRGASRTTDVPARLGGEEFAILLPETSAEEAEAMAERVRHAIELLEIPTSEHTLSITVSIGVATLSQPDQTVNELLKKADEALYEAKTTGRNRVVCAATNQTDPIDQIT